MPFLTQGKTNWKFLLIVVVLATIVGGGILLYTTEQKMSVTQLPETKKPENVLKEKVKEGCFCYGLLDKDFYLNKYIVQKGDTLLYIAKNELGDSSRVDELIELNKTWYSDISIQNPIIQEGWELRIPPEFFPESSGFLQGVGGEVLEDREDGIIINLKYGQQVKQMNYKTSQTKYLGQASFKPGDCVYIVKDFSARAGTGILAISPQDKNYFKEQQPELKNSPEIGGNCTLYGYLDKDFYLVKYVVQKGDTVFSIVQNRLGDTSRVNEIIHLNNPLYPHLSVKNPFIEIGWELWLPSSVLPSSSGFLVGYGGEVLSETNEYRPRFSISLTKDIPEEWKGANMEYGKIVFKSPRTKYFGQSDFKIGDCMYAIVDTGEHENYAIAISSQDKNYFK